MDGRRSEIAAGGTLLVTGAAGFIGINLARTFTAAGYRVVAHDHRPPPPDAAWFLGAYASRVDWIEGDIRDAAHLGALLQAARPARIVHAAAITPADERIERRRSRDIVEVNVMGTIGLMEAAIRAGTERILVLGSCSALGGAPAGGAKIPEGGHGGPETLYGISKLAQELVVRRYATLHGVDAVVVRVSQPYGPMERPGPERAAISPIGEWIEAAAAGLPLEVVDPEAAQDWIHIADLARAVHALVAAPRLCYRSYNLGLGALVPVKEVLAAIISAYPRAEVCHRPDGTPNRNLAPSALRLPLQVARLADEFSFRPQFDIAAGVADYAVFLKAQPSAGRRTPMPAAAAAHEP